MNGLASTELISVLTVIPDASVWIDSRRIVNDMSHLNELEHEKRRAERLASIEAIAAGLVHEIRNPLVP